jgi:hypothetical protein
MRRVVVALVVVSMAFVVAGCGGGSETPAADTPEAEVPAAPVAAPEVAPPTDKSPVEVGYPAPFPAITSTETPSVIQQKLDAGAPMAIFFYDGTQVVTTTQRVELEAALAEYRGLIDLITFNLAPGGTAPREAELAAAVGDDLGVTGTPYIILVDGNGYVTWRFKGFVDREIISREVLRATE